MFKKSIAVLGASGLVGKAVTDALLTRGIYHLYLTYRKLYGKWIYEKSSRIKYPPLLP